MRVADTCCCGAHFEASDSFNTAAVGIRHIGWLNDHAACRDAAIAVARKPSQPTEESPK